MTENLNKSGKVTYAGPHKFLTGNYSISLADSSGNKTYFQGKGNAPCKKDDIVDIEYTPVTSKDGQYINNVVSKVTTTRAKSNDFNGSDVRSNVDAGNMVSFAKDIVVAGIKQPVNQETLIALKGQVVELTKTCTKAFLEAKKLLEGKVPETEEPKEKPVPVVKPGQPEPQEDTYPDY